MSNLKNNESIHRVQSCITNVSFPKTIDDVLDMVDDNSKYESWITNLDWLLKFAQHETGWTWTAPKWLTTRDILFFYHAVTAKQRVSEVLKEAKEIWDNNKLIQFLERSADLANRYAGTIFGCAEVIGPSEYLEVSASYYKSKILAPLSKIHIFKSPLSSDIFTSFIKIERKGTITILGRKEFEELKQELSRKNDLPSFLQNAIFGEHGFYNINKDNWRSIICGNNTEFVHEVQVRTYFTDYLLDELKDNGTPLLQECQCFRGGKMTGIADYFVKLHGDWIPVEAKLNILAERNISSQLEKYIHIDSFVPTMGTNKGKVFEIDDLSICLVIDQSGIYVTYDSEFRNCSLGMPLWKREQLEHNLISVIRDYFAIPRI